MKSLGKIMAGAALAGTSLTGLGMVGAGTANAGVNPTAVHFPGSYWKTKAECQPYNDNYVKQIKATAGDRVVKSGCHLYERGWSYEVAYTGAGEMESPRTVKPGDVMYFDLADSKAPMAAWIKASRMTTWSHGSYSFDTKAKCDAAYTSVVNKIKAAGDKADLLPADSSDWDVTRACNATDVPGKWSYKAVYNAASHGNLFDYDTWESHSGDYSWGSTGTALPGGVYKTTSTENY